MQTVITGATGLVGANLAAILLEQGHKVRCTRRKKSRIEHLSHLPIEWVEADLEDAASLGRAFAGSEVVFHCAAEVSVRKEMTTSMRNSNVDGTGNVLAALAQAAVPRLVYASSTVTLGISTTDEDVSEEHPFNHDEIGLKDAYAQSKYQAEELVRRATSTIDAVIVNPGYMLGPYDSRPSSGQLIIDVLKGKVPGNSYGFNNFVDVRDVCRGMIAAWQKGRRGERYILGGHNLIYRDALALIARVGGVRAPRWNIPHAVARVIGWFGDRSEQLFGKEALLNSTRVYYAYCRGFRFRSDKAERELGYRRSPLEPAIADAISWFRQHGHLPPV